jgi:hypothetical protein
MGVRAELQDVEELEVVGRGRALTGEAEFHQDFINSVQPCFPTYNIYHY